MKENVSTLAPQRPSRIGEFAEGPDERARMGRISGWLWIVAALVGAGAAFLPGASHKALGRVIGLSALVLLYGVGSAPDAPRPVPSASIGWAVFPEDGEDFETLLRAADERMLRLKRNGGRPASER